MGNWEKKNGEDWERYDVSTFSEGTYRYSNQLRINSPLGEQYKFDETVAITIGGTYTLTRVKEEQPPIRS